MSRKVVVLIVEGVSDEKALSPLTRYVKDKLGIHIHTTHGDVFSDYKNSRKSIKSVIGDQITRVMNETKFKKKDIVAVIQITDTDGVFIDDTCVKVNPTIHEKRYEDHCIIVSNEQDAIKIRNRNKIKARKLRTMYSSNVIQSNVNYYLLYFSCNMDHVLHGERGPDDREKYLKAKEFDKKYKNPQMFKEFFMNQSFSVDGTLKDTWKFIEQDSNSLKKFSNFHLIFSILDSLHNRNID